MCVILPLLGAIGHCLIVLTFAMLLDGNYISIILSLVSRVFLRGVFLRGMGPSGAPVSAEVLWWLESAAQVHVLSLTIVMLFSFKRCQNVHPLY